MTKDTSEELKVDGWAVEVRVNGEDVLCIENICVSGVSDLSPYEDIIENCAHHLLSYIGRTTRPSTDMLVEALRGLLPFLEDAETKLLVGDEGCIWAVEIVRAALSAHSAGSVMRDIEVTDDMVEQAWITYVDASTSSHISNLEAMRAVLEEAIALSKQVSVKRTLYGPHGWLVGNKLLGEESWSLENVPPENDSDHFSVPLYTVANPFTIRARQALSAHSAGDGWKPKIKQLEWVEYGFGRSEFRAKTDIAHYVVWEKSGVGYLSSQPGAPGTAYAGGINAVKAVAQADFERRTNQHCGDHNDG